MARFFHILLPLGFALTGFGQGSAVPLDWAKRVPNISIRLDMTGGGFETTRSSRTDASATLRRSGPSTGRLSFGAGRQAGGVDTRTSQFLTVANGAKGSITVARRVPYLEWLTTFGRDWAPPDERFDFKWDTVGASLDVQAQTGGTPANPFVYITLTPVLSGLVSGRPERIAFTRASTRVIAGNGRTLPVGASGRNSVFFSKFMNGFAAGERIEPVRMSVTPTMMFAPPPGRADGLKPMIPRRLPPTVKELRIERTPLPPTLKELRIK